MNSWITDSFQDRPTTCMNCKAEFEKDNLFQIEVMHEVVKFGEGAGEYLVNEKYGDWHFSGHAHDTWETTKREEE